MKMIPGKVGPEYKSNAEKKVFKLLQDALIDGYAFHSVGLPEHEEKAYSEADFIVVTHLGVLCLEVKGGRVDCVDGEWTFEDRYGKRNTKHEGPFDQAAGALFALKSALSNEIKWAKNISYASGVIFTDISFDYRGVSVIPEIIYDSNFARSFADYIAVCHSYWDGRNRKKYTLLTDAEIEEIKRFIRDDLHFIPALSSIVNTTDEDLVRLTEEQAEVFDSLSINTRILVDGVAGSGKTLLAYRYAQQCAEKGKRVLFLVYNKMLANYLNVSPDSRRITVKHYHSLISDYVPIDPKKTNEPSYYSTTLPDLFLKYLSTHNVALYDTLVVDEGQDLLTIRNLNVFDKLLKGGLYSGNWVIFYDKNQNIYNATGFAKCMEQLIKYRPVQYGLNRNCRNTEQIVYFNQCISEMPCGKAGVSGEHVEFKPYTDNYFTNEFDTVVDKFIAEGIALRDIMVLSPVSIEKSIFATYHGKYCSSIERFSGNPISERICFSTVQAFKGLDSKIVVAVDLERCLDSGNNMLLYTLISRARTLLYIMLPPGQDEILRRKLVLKLIGSESK